MHSAPAVAFQAGDGGAWRLLATAGSALVTAVVAAWLQGWIDSWRVDAGLPTLSLPVVALSIAAAALLVAAWTWRQLTRPAPRLAWDGQHWSLQPTDPADPADDALGPAVPGQLSIRIDLGGWMLLQFSPDDGGPSVWVAAGARSAGPARAALVASGRRRPDVGEEAA